MSFTTVCPNCDARLTAPDTVLGKKVKCKKCDEPFVAKRTGDLEDHEDEAPPRKTVKVRRPADEDEKPARRSRDEDEDDDEPKPKLKKKGKKKKPAPQPVMLYVLIGVGALVLIGGGIGVYCGFIKEDKPADTPVAKGDGPKGPMAKGGPGAGLPINWVDFTAPDGTFVAKFPQQPVRKTEQIQTQVGPAQVDRYEASAGAILASVSHGGPPGGGVIDGVSVEEIEKLLDEICNAIAHDMGTDGGREVSRKHIDQDGRPGRELVIGGPNGSGGTARVFLAKGRIWTLLFANIATKPDPAMIEKFFGGFELK